MSQRRTRIRKRTELHRREMLKAAKKMFAELMTVVKMQCQLEEKIGKLIGIHLDLFERDSEFFQILASESPRLEPPSESRLKEEMKRRFRRHSELISAVMEEGISRGVLKDFEPFILTDSLIGMIHSATVGWLLSGRAHSLIDMKPAMLELFLHGALLRPGAAR